MAANEDTVASRRNFLRADAMAALAGTVGAAANAGAIDPHPDAELIRLGEKLEALWAQEQALPEDASDEDVDAAVASTGLVAREIEARNARTLDGLRVKARTLMWARGEETFGADMVDFCGGTFSIDCRLLADIVRDVLATGA